MKIAIKHLLLRRSTSSLCLSFSLSYYSWGSLWLHLGIHGFYISIPKQSQSYTSHGCSSPTSSLKMCQLLMGHTYKLPLHTVPPHRCPLMSRLKLTWHGSPIPSKCVENEGANACLPVLASSDSSGLNKDRVVFASLHGVQKPSFGYEVTFSLKAYGIFCNAGAKPRLSSSPRSDSQGLELLKCWPLISQFSYLSSVLQICSAFFIVILATNCNKAYFKQITRVLNWVGAGCLWSGCICIFLVYKQHLHK